MEFLQEKSSKLPNGHAFVVDKLESLQQTAATSPTKESVQMNGTNSSGENSLKNDMENSTATLTNKKKTAPPKLPPRSDSLNSLTKRPLPPTPSQVYFAYVLFFSLDLDQKLK